MKKIIGAIVLGLIAVFARPAQAADLVFTKFDSNITINADASIGVVETMTANFGTVHHGIFRTIPYRFTTLDGRTVSMPIVITAVTQDARPAQYTTSVAQGSVTLTIGDPDLTVTGEHRYTISYTAQAAVNFFPDHDELYWNVTGTEWDAPISGISATVRLPARFSAAAVTTTCYTGPAGSAAKRCQQSHDAASAAFTADEFLTIVVGWPTGAVAKPTDYDALRAQGTAGQAPSRPNPLSGGRLLVNLFLPAAVLAFMFRWWWAHGRDPGKKRTIIAQYDPPDDVRPAELSAIINEHASRRDISATIIDLAVRGYLKIIETDRPRVLGFGHGKDYILRRLKRPDESCRMYERSLMSVLFDDAMVPALEAEFRWSEIKERKYTTNPFASILKQVSRGVTERGYFVRNPQTTRMIYLTIGSAVMTAGILVGTMIGLLPGLIVSGSIIAAIGWFLPRRTAAGVTAAWVGHGFKLFLEKAEQYRLQWQEREHIFEKFLPYAMTFGVAEKWSKALAPMATTPPAWYEGAPGSAMNAIILSSALANFSSSVSSFAVSAAAGGSSGFSGGFSGGGGGGGGGGGW